MGAVQVPSGVPSSVRITGWAAAGVGALSVMSALGSALISSWMAQHTPTRGEIVPLRIAQSLPIALVQGTLGVLCAVAGLAFVRGRSWARYALLAVLYAIFPLILAMLLADSIHRRAEVGEFIAIASLLVIDGLAIRWLCSPTLRGNASPPTPTAQPVAGEGAFSKAPFRAMKILGRLVALGGAVTAVAAAMAVIFARGFMPRGPEIPQDWVFLLLIPVAVGGGSLLAVVGIAFTRHREWARRTLVVFAWLEIVRSCAMLAVPIVIARSLWIAHHQVNMLGAVIVAGVACLALTAGWIIGVLYLIRWLNGPAVRAACSQAAV